MSNVQSYNALIDRFHAFASGHFILKRFSHGQIEVSDLEKFGEYPFMHVVPSNVSYSKGMKTFSFQIVLADLPRDKEDKPEYQREVLSDLQRIAEDLVAEITNHRMLFGDLITVQNVTLEPFLEEFHHTLTGWTISLDLLVPYYWDACSIPAEWNDFFESGSGGTSSILTFIDSIVRDENGNVSLVNDEATPLPNYYYGTNNEGVRGWYLTTDNIGLTCETIGDCQTIIDIEAAIDALEEEILLKADITSISAVGFSNDYNDLDNLPTIPAAQVNSDWNATSGVAEILNKPTLTNGTVTAVTATAPMASTGGATPNLSMSSSNGTTNGYLLSSDWLIFNGKFNTPAGTTLQYVRGDGSLATFPTIPTSLPPNGAAGGDLTGTYPNPTVHRVHGIDMQNGTPTANDTWVYGGSPAKWQHQHLNASQVDNDSSVTGATVKLALEHLDNTKQANLVSGTNIKTINSTSLLGSGNVAVEPTITAGTTAQYWRGDKTWQTFPTIPTVGTWGALNYPTWVSGTPFVKMTAAGTFALDTNTYLTGITSSDVTTALGYTPVTNARTISTTGPLAGGGDLTANRTLSITQATTLVDGYLSATDWTTFNGKQAALVSGTNIKTINSTSLLGSGNITVGTFTLPSLTSGSVLFSDGTTIAQNNANFFWDNTNLGLAIGGTTLDAGYALQVNSLKGIRISGSGTGFGYSLVRGTEFSVFANNGSAGVFGSTTNLLFLTASTERMRININGNLLIGTTTDAGYKIDVNGTARIVNKLSVGTPSAASALMEVTSTTLGFLPPRMTTTQKNAIASPASGLVVYDTTLGKLCVRGAASWETITSI
jgi:hypothetical protein